MTEEKPYSVGVATSEELGVRIRRLRSDRGWTLQDLAERAGIALSTLSKIENAQVAPSFDSLVKVAFGLKIRFEALIADPTETPEPASPEPVPSAPVVARPAVGGRLMVTRRDAAVRFSSPIYDYHVHAVALRRKFMTPLIMDIKARVEADDAYWSSHDGEEFIFVLSGRVALHTEFYEPVTLDTGDSAYIDSSMRHRFFDLDGSGAQIASICYSADIELPDVMQALPKFIET